MSNRLALVVILIGILLAGSIMPSVHVNASSYPVATGPLEFAGGNGSPSSPYEIAMLEHLNNVRHHLDKHFVLSRSLSFTNIEDYENSNNFGAWTIGNGWPPIGSSSAQFTGSFDGNSHVISGLRIGRNWSYQGLFGYVGETGRITGLELQDVRIFSIQNNWKDHIGGLAGYSYGEISRVHVKGSVQGRNNVGGLVGTNRGSVVLSSSRVSVTGSGNYCGGLVGVSYAGTIEQSYAVGNVHSTGLKGIGGLIGGTEGGTAISNSYALGNVHGVGMIGGLVGESATSTLQNCWAGGVVSGSSHLGGLIGNAVSTNVQLSYYDTTVSQQTDNTGKGTPLTTTEMKSADSFDGWDFTSIWGITDTPGHISYPYLRQVTQIPAPGIAVRTYRVTYHANGASPGTAPVDNSSYVAGASVTLLDAPGNMTRAGYSFAGWNSAIDGSGTQYSVGDSFSIDPSNITLYAQWTATGMLQVNTSGLGSVRLNDSEQPVSGDYAATHPRGSFVRLTATPAEGYDFFYWEDINSRRIASTDTVFEGTLGLSLNLRAVFVQTPSLQYDYVTVVFRDKTRRILKSEEIARHGPVTPPPDPSLMGYSFLGWDDELLNIQSNIIVDAVYQRTDDTYEVTVAGGTLSVGGVAGAFRFDTRISIVAGSASEGQKFSHWEQDGRRIGVARTLTVYTPMTSTVYTACYVSEATVLLDEPFLTMSDYVMKDHQKNSVTFTATRYVPAYVSLVESGVIILRGEIPAGGLTLDTPGVQLGMVPNNSTHHFYMVKNDVQAGEVWHARGYMVYRNASGELVTVYSEVVTTTGEY